MGDWALQDAAARFGEMLDLSRKNGPQVVMADGKPQGVLVSMSDWEKLKQGHLLGPSRKFDMKAWLVAPEARGDIPVPARGEFGWREPPSLDD